MEEERAKCPYCEQVERVVKAGTNHTGSKRHRCQNCQRYFTVHKKPMGYDPLLKAQAVQLCLEGMSFRAVGRTLSINFQSVINWFNQAHDALPHQVEDQMTTETVEIDELFTYVGKKRGKPTL